MQTQVSTKPLQILRKRYGHGLLKMRPEIIFFFASKIMYHFTHPLQMNQVALLVKYLQGIICIKFALINSTLTHKKLVIPTNKLRAM